MINEYLSYSGYPESIPPDTNIQVLFSPRTIKYIQHVVYNNLKCIFPQGVIVPCETISNVLSDTYSSYRPPTGDIYSRYTIPNNELAPFEGIINQTIQIITDNVRNTLQMEQRNNNLTIWTTVLGDFNRDGLRSHAPIKVLDKHPQHGLFFENY